MADILIRGLSDAAVSRIDAAAAARGLSRQEYLRRRFETGAIRGAMGRQAHSQGHPARGRRGGRSRRRRGDAGRVAMTTPLIGKSA